MFLSRFRGLALAVRGRCCGPRRVKNHIGRNLLKNTENQANFQKPQKTGFLNLELVKMALSEVQNLTQKKFF